MKRLLLPLVMVIVGLGGGLGAGFLVKKEAPQEVAATAVDCPPPERPIQAEPAIASGETEFVKFHNQFMVPVMQQGVVEGLVVLSLSVEVRSGYSEEILDREPKLRDGFLRVMFDHANAGGFSGNFLTSVGLDALRGALVEVAQGITGPMVRDVLIVDLVRQDV